MGFAGWGWRPYVSVGERRRKAMREMEKRRKQGHAVSPVSIEGRAIARTFWGKAWCENLERYSDFANRLPRGRTYVRNGSVVDLQITPGAIHAYVSGSDLYKVEVKVAPVAKARWKSICGDCAGAIDSLVELLQGRLSKGVMERICRPNQGLFPSPAEIQLSCSCPDWAGMCKHIAAVLYGIGARFDNQPELLFRLRAVDEMELIASAGQAAPLAKQGPAAGKLLESEDLSAIFGLDMAQSASPDAGLGKPAKPRRAAKGRKPRKRSASAQRRKRPAGARKPRRPAEE
ncbi:MAG: SWIM zinc finger family protein [Acidobacteria bacterium]|nr:SWIM zinc finger family protein [Acidobacteriota bacterium]